MKIYRRNNVIFLSVVIVFLSYIQCLPQETGNIINAKKSDFKNILNEDTAKDTLAPYIEIWSACSCFVSIYVADEPRYEPEKRSNLGDVVYMFTDSYNFTYLKYYEKKTLDLAIEKSYAISNKYQPARAHFYAFDINGNRRDTVFICNSKTPTAAPGILDFGKILLKNNPIEINKSFKIFNYSENDFSKDYEMYFFFDSDSTENKQGDINTSQHFEITNFYGYNVYHFLFNNTIEVNIKFTASEKGKFKDSLGVVIFKKNLSNSTLEFQEMKYIAELSAVVGENSIEVSDYTFGNIKIDEILNSEITVKNNTDAASELSMPVKISGFHFAGDEIGLDGSGKSFEIGGLENISMENPLFLQPAEEKTFAVKFHPKEVKEYSGSLIFESDAEKTDHVTYLTGMGTISSVQEKIISDNIQIHSENGNLKLASDENYLLDNIEIYDLSGKLVLAEKVDRDLNGYSINISEFVNGVYIVKIKLNGLWLSKKMVK